MKKYQIIYADPPWRYKRTGGSSAERAYKTMSIEEISNLPIGEIADKNSILFLWATNAFLHDAFHIIDSWGFSYKTCMTWDKESQGLGYWLWGKTEHLLLSTRGKPFRNEVPIASTIYRERKGKHSKKPESLYSVIERMGGEPRIELFARQKVEGWACWGNEVESDIEL